MTNKKYLIAFDMDGTLLTDKDKIISPKTLQYLRQLTAEGHLIVLASGRPESELFPYYEELGLNTPLACFNGVAVIHPKDKSFKPFTISYPRQWAMMLKDHLFKLGWTNVFCETNEDIWLQEHDDELVDMMWPHGIQRNLILGDLCKTMDKDPISIIFYKKDGKDIDKQTNDYILKFPNAEPRYWFGHDILEIAFGHGKEDGLEYIRQYYDIPKENTIAFGDFLNDTKMLLWAQHGVAMKNAVEPLKKVARYITEEDNNHDGIIATLKSILESN